jgi:hypothetical protein
LEKVAQVLKLLKLKKPEIRFNFFSLRFMSENQCWSGLAYPFVEKQN